MIEAYLYRDAPEIEQIREVLTRFVVAEETDDKTSPHAVRLCVDLLEEIHTIKGLDMPDEVYIESEKDGYEAYYEGYVRAMYDRPVEEDDYDHLCLCPPDHVCVPGLPRKMAVLAGRVSAQKSKAAMRAYQRMVENGELSA